MKCIAIFLCMALFHPLLAHAAPTLNVYAWGGEIPQVVVKRFETETGIRVNFSTYDNNETMYTKLKAGRTGMYDVILPSAYYVERMKKQGMLARLDHQKLPHLVHLDPLFTQNDYDESNHYSVPFIWGTTGIFYNKKLTSPAPTHWRDLWKPHWKQQLLLLDDSREVFSMALMRLGFQPNDNHPEHVRAAYEQLLALSPNIKLFASDSVQAIVIDEDARLGMVWNGDAYKAHQENDAIEFTLPHEGFVIWVDCLAIPANAPHPHEAHQFINFLLKPEVAATVGSMEGHAITNASGKALLPESMRDNPLLYPSKDTLERGHFQRDIEHETIKLYNQYWEKFKLSL